MYLALNRSRIVPRPHVNGAAAFETLFGDFFAPAVRAQGASNVLAPRFEVVERDDRFEARLEIPGVAKEDIDVQIDGAQVRVKADAKVAEKVDGERLLASNRVARSWARSFTLPVEVADDRAEAAYENGVLTLTLPKKEVVQPKRLTIK